LCQRARPADGALRARAHPAGSDLAPHREGSADAPPCAMDRLGGLSGAIPRSQALRADVLMASPPSRSRWWHGPLSLVLTLALCAAALEVAARVFWRIEYQLSFRRPNHP